MYIYMCFEGIIPVVVSALAYFIRYIYYGIMILGLWCLTPLFNNISIISWRSVLLAEETGVPRENHRPVVSHWQTLSHNVVSSTPHSVQDSNSQLQWW